MSLNKNSIYCVMLRSSKNANQRKQWWYRVAGYSAVSPIFHFFTVPCLQQHFYPLGKLVTTKYSRYHCSPSPTICKGNEKSTSVRFLYNPIHLLCIITAMFYYFTPIVNMNRVEKCMYNKCMGLYGSPTTTRVNDLVIVYCFYIQDSR